MDGLLGLLFVVAVFIVPLLVAYYAIVPVHHASRGRGRKVQTFLIDIIALLILIQVVLAVTVPIFRDRFEDASYFIAVLLAGLIAAMWRAAVDALSQLEVRQASRRLLMHLVYLPGACGLMVSAAFGIGALVVVLTSHEPEAWNWLGWNLLIVSLGVWFLRALGNWIIKGSAPLSAEQHLPVSHQPDA